MARKHGKSYWQLRKDSGPLTSLLQLGTMAEHYRTPMAHAMIRAVAHARYHGSAYGWEDEQAPR